MSWVGFIRHGKTTWNEEGRIQGQCDTTLSDAGRETVRGYRVPAGWLSADWVSSPLERARETATLLRGHAPVCHPALMEMDWGEWEGRTLDELRSDRRWDVPAMEARGLDFRPPGGESPRDVARRLAAWLATVPATAPLVAVTHKGVIRAALSLATGWDMTADAAVRLRWDCAHRFTRRPGGALLVDTLNISLRGPAAELTR